MTTSNQYSNHFLRKLHHHTKGILLFCSFLFILFAFGYYAVIEVDKFPGSRLVEFYPPKSARITSCAQTYSPQVSYSAIYKSSDKSFTVEAWFEKHWKTYPTKKTGEFRLGNLYFEAHKEVAFRFVENDPSSYYGILTEIIVCK